MANKRSTILYISCLAHAVQDGLTAAVYVLLPVLALSLGLNLGAPSSALISLAYVSGGRRGALGLYNSSGDAGKLAYATCFSLAIGAGLAWSSATTAFGLSGVAAAVVILLAVPHLARRMSPENVAEDSRNKAEAAEGWGILDRRGFIALFLVVFLDSLVQAGVLTFAAFLILAKEVPLATATFAATAILIGGIFGKAICGFLADRIGPRLAFILIQALTAAGITAAVFAPGYHAYILLPFLGVVLQGSTSITYSMVNDLVHESRASRGFALIYGGASFSSVAGPLGCGVFGDLFGIETAMLIMAVIAVTTIPPCLYLRVKPKDSPQ